MASSPDYRVPALEKGLDILECLANQGIALSQAQIARELNRGPNELFRMLFVLQRRGYIQRDETSGAYSLTLRLFELSHTHSPFKGLLSAAARPMRDLTEQIRESCHLSVLHHDALLVVAQEESPRRLRLSVEVGAKFSSLETVSGRLLIANLKSADQADFLSHHTVFTSWTTEQQNALRERLDLIRARGYEEAQGERIQGVRDLAVLIGAPNGHMQAALTVAILGVQNTISHDELLTAMQQCAAEISHAAGLVVAVDE